jgi:LysR family hydrogen peroxide-inducible transcriptional activator
MDLRQLSALVAVAENGSFSAAADVLHTVQSNVSTHVARLERELGAQLIDRNGCQVTEEGQAVVDRARRIAQELEAIRNDVAAIRHEVVGTVRLGLIGTTARWLVPLLLGRMAELHPKVHLIVVDATSTSLEPQLASGALDLAVVNLPIPLTATDLVAHPLFDEDLVLVVDPEHPLAGQKQVGMADLDGMALLLPAPGTAFRNEIDAGCKSASISLQPRAELDGVRLMASLTFEGHGPAILPATAVPAWLHDRWKLVPVTGLPPRKVGIAQRRRGLPGAPARALTAVLEEVIAENLSDREGLHPPAP